MENLWSRRATNSGKLTLSTTNSTSNRDGPKTESPRTFSGAKGFGSHSSHGGKNPLSAVTPGGGSNTASPAVGGSSAFGLGSGAFASFGSSKPKTHGNAIEVVEKQDRDAVRAEEAISTKKSSSALGDHGAPSRNPIKNTWVVWYRPPTSKYSDYEKSIIALASFGSVETFWNVYTHLKRPSELPSVSDYHIFKKGIRPVWEDEENKRGGKWILRLKKGVADRYWEDLLLAVVGDQFAEAGEEVCGAVLSVRSGEDVLSIWTRIDGGRNIKIRETVKRLLILPSDTSIVWKSHDDSIAQRSAMEQVRQEKNTGSGSHVGRRRDTLMDESTPERSRN